MMFVMFTYFQSPFLLKKKERKKEKDIPSGMLCSLTALSCSRDGEGASITVEGERVVRVVQNTEHISGTFGTNSHFP